MCSLVRGKKLSYFTFERTFSENIFPFSNYTYNLDWQFDIPALSNVEDWMIRILSFPDDTSNHLNCKYRNFWYSFDVLLRRDIKWIMNALTTKVYTRLISLKYFHFLLSIWQKCWFCLNYDLLWRQRLPQTF